MIKYLDRKTLDLLKEGKDSSSSRTWNKFLVLEYVVEHGASTKGELEEFLQSQGKISVTKYPNRVVHDYLSELEKTGLLKGQIRRPGTKEWLATTRLRELELIPIDKRHAPQLLQWQKMFEKYSFLPIFGDIGIFIDENQSKFLDYFNDEIPETYLISDFETVQEDSGVKFIGKFYEAIEICEAISFRYKGFEGDVAKSIMHFMPYILKEHNKRWYVVGQIEGGEGFRPFPLDRITELLDEDESEFVREPFDPDTHWKNSIGIYTGWKDEEGNYQSEPIKITFEVKDGEVVTDGVKPITNIPYLKTVQIHTSQILVEHKDGYARVSLTTYPNADLVRVLRALGQHNLRNIKPEFLSDWVLKG